MHLKLITLILGVFCIIATLLPLIKAEAWWIRIFDFPRVQVLVLGTISLLFYLYLYKKTPYDLVFIISLSCALIYQAKRIFPYTSLHKYQVVKADNHLKGTEITFYITNVYMKNKRSDLCLKAIKKSNPDVILALETDEWWKKELLELDKSYPYSVKIPLNNTYGMILYSKLKLVNPEIKFLVESDVPSIHTLIELKSGKRIMFYGVHPKPPAPNESDSSLPRDAELILVAKDSRKKRYPVIVAGDLNDVAWSHTTHLFQRTSGLLDPRIGRGMFSTFNSKYPLLRWPLDHLFHSDHFQIINLERIGHINSDHFPICVKLCYVPIERDLQEAPLATQEDKKEAKEKVEEVMEK